ALAGDSRSARQPPVSTDGESDARRDLRSVQPVQPNELRCHRRWAEHLRHWDVSDQPLTDVREIHAGEAATTDSNRRANSVLESRGRKLPPVVSLSNHELVGQVHPERDAHPSTSSG